MMKLRKELNAANEGKEGGNKFTVNDFVMKAAVQATVAVPEVNASFAGDSVVRYRETRLAVAVAIDDGLVTPVIREAQDKSLLELSVAIKDLAERARTKKLSPDEMQGGTLTISNLGGYGVEQFDAIINPPQAAILSIGTIVRKPVVNESGEIVAGQRMKHRHELRSSCHRWRGRRHLPGRVPEAHRNPRPDGALTLSLPNLKIPDSFSQHGKPTISSSSAADRPDTSARFARLSSAGKSPAPRTTAPAAPASTGAVSRPRPC